ncbi:glycerophosphodiester phosphodiesterase family protein [Sporosarcina sp. D27]|uniref:glycerophosphodiester phosphodiesterase family protein n=1 Tax=Sporosarcina sp. D27 TaxID=1382305 RepID=UPI000472F16C|nr:glycerophosphodiester phosphodiesterase family protein [Sporosarcina sp. D27]
MKLLKVGTILLLFLSGCSPTYQQPVSLPSEPFLVIAHRGASAYAPAHTFPSYELAIEMGAHYIELDLHRTKDGKLVVLHNDSIELNGSELEIDEITTDTLSAFKPADEFNRPDNKFASQRFTSLRVPSLEQVLREFGDQTNYYIEIKSPDRYPGIEQQLFEQLDGHHLLDRDDPLPKVIIQSFSSDSLKKVHELSPTTPLIQLYSFKKKANLSSAKLKQVSRYASGIGVNAEVVTEQLVEAVHQSGLAIHPFTVNQSEQASTLISLGVNGIFTDKPDLIINLLHQNSK